MSILTALTNAGFLSEHDADELDLQIQANASVPRGTLRTLYQYLEEKVLGPVGGGFLMVDQGGEYEIGSEAISAYRHFIDMLFQHDLFTETTYKKVRQHPMPLNEGKYVWVLRLILETQAFYDEFTPEKQQAFAALLQGERTWDSGGMTLPEKGKELQRDIADGKLETYLDFFKYCYGCRIIDTSGYDTAAHLLTELAAIYNEVTFTAPAILSATLREEDNTGEPFYDERQATIDIDTGDRIVSYRYTFNGHGEDKTQLPRSVIEHFLNAANTLLADQARNYRLMGVTDTLNQRLFPGSYRMYAICRVDQGHKQLFNFDDMQRRFMFGQPTHLVYRASLTYRHIQYAIHHFEQCGLLAHLDNDEKAAVTANMFDRTYSAIDDLLAEFPDVITAVCRYISGPKAYQRFLQALDRASQGVLAFTDIIDRTPDPLRYEDDTEFTVSFRCNNKPHKVVCSAYGKEFNPKIIFYIVNEIIRKDHPEHRLVVGYGGTNDLKKEQWLFVNARQCDYLKRMKLWEFMERY